jgi:hypothetical protein
MDHLESLDGGRDDRLAEISLERYVGHDGAAGAGVEQIRELAGAHQPVDVPWCAVQKAGDLPVITPTVVVCFSFPLPVLSRRLRPDDRPSHSFDVAVGGDVLETTPKPHERRI